MRFDREGDSNAPPSVFLTPESSFGLEPNQPMVARDGIAEKDAEVKVEVEAVARVSHG